MTFNWLRNGCINTGVSVKRNTVSQKMPNAIVMRNYNVFSLDVDRDQKLAVVEKHDINS